MRKNRLKQMYKEGKPIVNGWLQIPHSFSAEVMSHQGWDSLTIDMQHGVVDYPNALQMLQAISTTDTIPLARVNWNEPGQIMKILDAGCYGVICPMVSNRTEAEKFVIFKRQLFSHKRKSLKNLLKKFYIDKQFDLNLRVENLELEQLIKIFRYINNENY